MFGMWSMICPPLLGSFDSNILRVLEVVVRDCEKDPRMLIQSSVDTV